jgi:hypothetical protein
VLSLGSGGWIAAVRISRGAPAGRPTVVAVDGKEEGEVEVRAARPASRRQRPTGHRLPDPAFRLDGRRRGRVGDASEGRRVWWCGRAGVAAPIRPGRLGDDGRRLGTT